jgi:hypothetical protein
MIVISDKGMNVYMRRRARDETSGQMFRYLCWMAQPNTCIVVNSIMTGDRDYGII